MSFQGLPSSESLIAKGALELRFRAAFITHMVSQAFLVLIFTPATVGTEKWSFGLRINV